MSKAALREKPFSRKFNYIMTDSLILMLFALVLVVLAAALEVYVFPLF
ncbi:MAG: hypothetical protein KJ601_04115 [Nanoarchaeota archaeon]|nr:hypothetical protein [Nanoarchaeota archaeon]